KVAAWLTPMDYNAVQHEKLQQRVDETGQWFIQSSDFLDWVDSPVARPLLWCVGGPAVGKTILASTTINHLRTKFKNLKDEALVFCIFCDYHAPNQKPIAITRSLLKQLIQARRCLTNPIETLYDTCSGDGMPLPSLEDITHLLCEELKSYKRIYIILDALDELSDDRCRQGVLDALKALGNHICILMTSRPLDTMQSYNQANRIHMRVNDADLEKCVIAGLAVGHLPALLSKDGTLGERIRETAVKKADGMFLLANIHMDLLAHCTNRRQLNTELDKLPRTLQKAYEYLLARIDSLPGKDLAYRVFGLVAFAAQPLDVEELQYALAIESGTKKMDPANITDEGIILSICAGLIVIDHSRCFKFVHYSTQEYFVSQEDKLFPHIHVDFTCICLAHMSFNALFDSNGRLILFSWYSMYYWDFHACKCSGISTAKEILAFLDDKLTQMEDIAQPFPEQEVDFSDPTFFAGMVHAVKLVLAAPEVDFQHLHGLCLAAYVGNCYVVLRLLAYGLDIDCKGQVPFLREVPDTSLSPAQKDGSGCRGSCAPLCTPLIAAASNGHEKTVRRLLEDGPLLNTMSSSGLTALSSAIICNSIPVVTLLLQKDDIDTSIQFKGQTPFMLAARYGFTEIMELFLERQKEDPNAPGENRRTALHAAVEESQHGSIDLLLKSGQVDMNRKDSRGRTALSIAARLGSVQSVKRLVDHVGTDVLAKGNDGKSVYDIVVEGGQQEVVTLLTEYAAKGLGTE
ncbi:ankyrin repeat-containing domain protein, partial [Armillaria novae-zelandiae]